MLIFPTKKRYGNDLPYRVVASRYHGSQYYYKDNPNLNNTKLLKRKKSGFALVGAGKDENKHKPRGFVLFKSARGVL